MTTVILINFNLEFYFGTQLFVISGVNYLINHKENGKKGKNTVTSRSPPNTELGQKRNFQFEKYSS